jgi:hypothetical protein
MRSRPEGRRIRLSQLKAAVAASRLCSCGARRDATPWIVATRVMLFWDKPLIRHGKDLD